MSNYGPDATCERTTCASEPPHKGGEHIDPRSERYDGPDATFGALPEGARRAARALKAAGAPVPEIVDMAREILRLRSQVAAVQVDKDRSVREASKRALSCEKHGEQIRALEGQVDHSSKTATRHDNARKALLGLLHSLRETVDAAKQRTKLGEPLPSSQEIIAALDRAVKQASAAHDRAWKAGR